MMKIEALRKGGRVLKGNCIAFHSPVKEMASQLPRLPSEIQSVFVVRGLSSEGDREEISHNTRRFRVRRAVVERALRWLQENCPPYEDISIEESRLSCLPEDGSIFDALRSERESQSQGDDADQRVRCPHCGVQATRCTCFLSHVDPSAEEEDNNGGAQSNNLGPAYHQMPGPDDVSETEEGVSTWGHYHDGSDVEDPVTLRVNILRGTTENENRDPDPQPDNTCPANNTADTGPLPGARRDRPINLRVCHSCSNCPVYWLSCRSRHYSTFYVLTTDHTSCVI